MKFNEIWKSEGKTSATEVIASYPTLLVCRALDKHNQHKRVFLISQCKRCIGIQVVSRYKAMRYVKLCVSFERLDAHQVVWMGDNAIVFLKPDVVFTFEC